MKFKSVLIALLADKNFSIPGLAELVGVSSKSVYDWVNGKFEPSKKHYAKIAEYFHISEAELLSRVFTPDPEPGWIKIPVLGNVPAGNPLEAIEEHRDFLSVPAKLGKHIDFGLIVKGSSMIGAGILDNDIVFVKSQPVAENRQIVVARLNGDTTVKRFFRTDHSVILRPENPDFDPILIGPGYPGEFAISGIVTGLWRSEIK